MDEIRWMDLAEEAGHLREALVSRERIDEAKGMIMALRGCESDAAFAELRELSSTANVKLHRVASALVDCAIADREVAKRLAVESPLAALVYNTWVRFMPVPGTSEPAAAVQCLAVPQREYGWPEQP